MQNINVKPVLFLFALMFISQPLTFAKIIYRDVSPDEIQSKSGSLKLDINDDGKYDLQIDLNILSSTDIWLTMEPMNGAKVAMENWHAKAFSTDSVINNNFTWRSTNNLPLAYLTSGTAEGPWPGKLKTYLGVQFQHNGEQHFGWIQIEVSETVKNYRIKDMAYEDAAIPIIAGDKFGPVGLKESQFKDLEMIIKPGYASVISKIENPGNLLVSDISGRIVANFEYTKGANHFNINQLNTGIYIFSLRNEKGILSRKIFIP